MSVDVVRQLIDYQAFYHRFQPILNLNSQTIVGYEALLRSEWIDAPDEFFRSIQDRETLLKLDKLSVSHAVKQFNESDVSSGVLCINVLPSTVSTVDFPSFLSGLVNDYHMAPDQVIVELVELEAIKNLDSLKESVQQLKDYGFLLSIDDVGKGSSSFRLMIELEPDIIKMDRYFTSELAYSTLKQKMIESLIGYCKETNTQFILEGIESASHLDVARQLGVEQGQGFYLAEPFLL
ncbi:EAL domain-containing protein [Alkalibacillus salilacus]|uniref:EAL domain-containing protein (Putative c-di-GMP-specific phosphodiesterase class I) n=1 Tax=Alkalibacillus salilacus TaxID=284582 RepID=A0ABT9VEP2_9BACI|nr:EAL domain-containing protein [Alkalibacillus salilacus]MDQ0159442.1 EAL domain-containing protein (putative c-di-GMP-specific phosphodiesterase class I) [Alkalibacillus salilacus]